MNLFYRVVGEGPPIVIMHGIFGSSDNWLTQARLLSPRYKVFSLDLRNHGQSPHSPEFDYPAMVADLVEFINTHKLEQPVVVGHSMGGKVAMNFAVAHPDMLSRLIVVDIAPRNYDLGHYVILDGLKAVPIDTINTRSEADEALARFVPEQDVRQFLLKNLQRKQEGGFTWKINLPVIGRNMKGIGDDLFANGKFEKPVLFIRGGKSRYIADEDFPRIREVFPAVTIETLDTGHWVQAEKPHEFVQLVQGWLDTNVD